jgi:hypothetical protein
MTTATRRYARLLSLLRAVQQAADDLDALDFEQLAACWPEAGRVCPPAEHAGSVRRVVSALAFNLSVALDNLDSDAPQVVRRAVGRLRVA